MRQSTHERLLLSEYASSRKIDRSLHTILGTRLSNKCQLKKRVVGELQFQPTETGEFTLLRGHGVELRERTREHGKKTTIKFRLTEETDEEAAHDQVIYA